jgi:hypothetical protein
MEKLISQMQAVLSVLTTILPLAPAKNRTAIADALEAVAAALKLGDVAVAAASDLAEKFAVLRAETEAMTQVGEADLEAAFERVRAASMAFRAAYAQSAPL